MKLALPDNETWKGQYKKIKLETNNLMKTEKNFLIRHYKIELNNMYKE